MGICNGFQTLVEAGLLPGGLIRNTGLKFVCRYVNLRVETTDTPFTSACEAGELLRIVVKHNEGNYTVDPETLARMQANDQIVLRYVNAAGERAEGANPNGALDDIAGVCNETRNVFGMMPHPENSVEAALAGGADGRRLFQSIIDTVLRHRGGDGMSRRATLEAAVKLGLTAEEYAHICEIQGGEPTYVELAIYSLMWSEHCSYKHSRPDPRPLPHQRAAHPPGPRRERRHHRRRRRLGRGHEGREPQPSVGGRALPGRRHRRRRHRPRHLHHGRAAVRQHGLAALRRAHRAAPALLCSTASSAASPTTATASASPPSAARSTSSPATRATAWSTP